jgi:hypothetical protein
VEPPEEGATAGVTVVEEAVVAEAVVAEGEVAVVVQVAGVVMEQQDVTVEVSFFIIKEAPKLALCSYL